jgi:hypothetical protein
MQEVAALSGSHFAGSVSSSSVAIPALASASICVISFQASWRKKLDSTDTPHFLKSRRATDTTLSFCRNNHLRKHIPHRHLSAVFVQLPEELFFGEVPATRTKPPAPLLTVLLRNRRDRNRHPDAGMLMKRVTTKGVLSWLLLNMSFARVFGAASIISRTLVYLLIKYVEPLYPERIKL